LSVYITSHWLKPDPELVAHELYSLANELEELIEPLTISGEITRMDIQENFDTGTDPDGESWAPWSPRYEPYALAHSTGPIFGGAANLHLTGDLESAATARSNFIATNSGLFLNTGGFPEYWAWNHFGATRQTTGSGGGVTEGEVKSRAKQILVREFKAGNKITAKAAARMAFAEFSGTGTNELPSRPFVGLSREARAKIDAAFVAWFEGEISMAVSPTGKTFGRHSKRGPGGRFVKRGT